MVMSNAELSALSAEEKLALIERLWSSIASDPDVLPLSEADRAELDRRLAAIERDPSATVTWDELRSRVRPS
jgi:putative addiction module component (TIGR02574 family)